MTRERPTTRRQWLGATGVALGTVLTGCGMVRFRDTGAPDTPNRTPAPPPTEPVEAASRLPTPDLGVAARFGSAVDVSGPVAVVGAPHDAVGGVRRIGTAHVYERTDGRWHHRARLTAQDPRREDRFGGAVAVDVGTVVVGTIGRGRENGDYAGSVTVFERTGDRWHREAELTASDGDDFDHFGRSVEISGETAMIGAPRDEDPNGEEAGTVYAFERRGGGWRQRAKLTADDGTPGDGFGGSVALEGDVAFVGANSFFDPAGSYSSAVYVFERTGATWSQTQKITVDGISPRGNFGNAVALSGDSALVGAFSDDTPSGDNVGSAYVFGRDGEEWRREERLIADAGEHDDAFGIDVALGDDVALVGATGDDNSNGTDAGCAYLFERSADGWSQHRKLLATDDEVDGLNYDSFGLSAALGDDVALVGAPSQEGPQGKSRGGAYVFEV